MDKDGENKVARMDEGLAECTANVGGFTVTARAGKDVLGRDDRGTFRDTRLQREKDKNN
jgi:hypothetical protein